MSKAVLVGAKTVNCPGCLRVSISPAACTAVRRVLNLGLVLNRSATVWPELLVSTGVEARELVEEEWLLW